MAESEAAGVGRATAFEGLRGHARRAWIVGALSLFVMVLELGAGWALNSMALVSDGLHTSTHVGVMVAAAYAYVFVERRRDDPRFAFGPGKVVSLVAFASGAGLAVVAVFIGLDSLARLIRPEPVAFREAAVVAAVSLVVGGVSARLLHQSPARPGGERDLNLWAAYLHMLADVVTSLLALAGLVAGAVLGWSGLDALVGMVNAAVVAAFAARLIRESAAPLLDMAPDPPVAGSGRSDVRIWSVGPGALAALVRPVGGQQADPSLVRSLARTPGVKHVLVELTPD